MEILILGPVRVLAPDPIASIDGPRSKALLSALVFEAGRYLTVDDLISYAWEGELPRTVRRQVRNRVNALRRLLITGGCRREVITSRRDGFIFQPGGARVDVAEFLGLVDAGMRMAATDPAPALKSLRAGLDLWRGPVFAELDTPRLRSAAAYLTEKRIGALERCMAIQLALGRDSESIPELSQLTDTYPTHERFATLLMLALYRSGRQADALAVFHATRRRLVDELGIVPGGDLQSVHEKILRADPDLAISLS
jgi:DNA-binding SARP family transcriptional activator